jgi:hypothetical protein
MTTNYNGITNFLAWLTESIDALVLHIYSVLSAGSSGRSRTIKGLVSTSRMGDMEKASRLATKKGRAAPSTARPSDYFVSSIERSIHAVFS